MLRKKKKCSKIQKIQYRCCCKMFQATSYSVNFISVTVDIKNKFSSIKITVHFKSILKLCIAFIFTLSIQAKSPRKVYARYYYVACVYALTIYKILITDLTSSYFPETSVSHSTISACIHCRFSINSTNSRYLHSFSFNLSKFKFLVAI